MKIRTLPVLRHLHDILFDFAEATGLGRVNSEKQSRSDTPSKTEGKKAQFATFMDLCHIKNSELEKMFRYCEGRFWERRRIYGTRCFSVTHMTAAKVLDEKKKVTRMFWTSK